jgi:hypothetical protein
MMGQAQYDAVQVTDSMCMLVVYICCHHSRGKTGLSETKLCDGLQVPASTVPKLVRTSHHAKPPAIAGLYSLARNVE